MSKSKNISKRTVTRVLNEPYKVGDEDRDFIVEEMIADMLKVNKMEAEIAPLKEEMKKSQSAADKARDKLVKGKPVDVKVEETYNFDECMVHAKRLDTNEKLPSREMTEEDHQTDIIDETTPLTHETGKDNSKDATSHKGKRV